MDRVWDSQGQAGLGFGQSGLGGLGSLSQFTVVSIYLPSHGCPNNSGRKKIEMENGKIGTTLFLELPQLQVALTLCDFDFFWKLAKSEIRTKWNKSELF